MKIEGKIQKLKEKDISFALKNFNAFCISTSFSEILSKSQQSSTKFTQPYNFGTFPNKRFAKVNKISSKRFE